MLIALVAVDRASPWIAAVIVGRELIILGLRGVAAADGTVFAPSPARQAQDRRSQFVAILLAILRPGEKIGGPPTSTSGRCSSPPSLTVATGVDYFAALSAAAAPRRLR